MNSFANVPPGFRFHPTDEELVDYYLRKKIVSEKIDLDIIKAVDLYKIEPWDLQELCSLGTEEQDEWYFFSHKDKKYPTGTRTNRATKLGFWKATGRDKAIYARQSLIGMRKTLVFYKGRAPNGYKTDWIMHEYRLEINEHGTPHEEGWVVCRVFKKRIPATQRMDEYDPSICNWFPDFISPESSHRFPNPNPNPNPNSNNNPNHLNIQSNTSPYHFLPLKQDPFSFLHLPHLDNPNSSSYLQSNNNNNENIAFTSISQDEAQALNMGNDEEAQNTFLAAEEIGFPSKMQGEEVEYASVSGSSSCQIDMWK